VDTLVGPVLRGEVGETQGDGVPRPRPAVVGAAGAQSIAVIVTTHRPYLRFLRNCLESVRCQTIQPEERILIVDDAPVPEWVGREFGNWRIMAGAWHDPNKARNVAIAEAKGDWVVVVDGDNWLHPEYVGSCRDTISRAPARVAIVYADLDRWTTPDGPHRGRDRLPERWNYWNLRLRNYISTTSAMKRAAVLEAGGYGDTDSYDDWALAHRMSARGWVGQWQPIPICVRHGGVPHRVGTTGCRGLPFMHGHRTYGILSLMAGREAMLGRWTQWLLGAWLPRHVHVYALDNSRTPGYGRSLRAALEQLGESGRFDGVTYLRSNRVPDPSLSHWRSWHVGQLYNEALPAVGEDMVLTIEDDMVPPPNGFRQLIDCQPARVQFGAVAAAYLSRLGGGRVCAAFGRDYCDGRVYKRHVRQTLMPVGVVGGGFTLWANALLKTRCLPFRFEHWGRTASEPGTPTAWDTIACADIAAAKYKVGLLGSCWADHVTVTT